MKEVGQTRAYSLTGWLGLHWRPTELFELVIMGRAALRICYEICFPASQSVNDVAVQTLYYFTSPSVRLLHQTAQIVHINAIPYR
jgi:hypothetical protein